MKVAHCFFRTIPEKKQDYKSILLANYVPRQQSFAGPVNSVIKPVTKISRGLLSNHFQSYLNHYERIAMDIVGPLPKSSHGNWFVLVICDYAMRYPEAVPLKCS